MNENNLIPCSERTPEERAEMGRRGGIASGEARREKRKTLDMLEMLLAEKVETEDGKKMSREELYMLKVIQRGIRSGSIDLLDFTAKLRGEMVNKTEMDVSGNIPAVLTEEMIIEDEPEQKKAKRKK